MTCKTEKNTILSSEIIDGKYKGSVEFSTCRKFKGLEGEGIILVDVDKEIFEDANIKLFYVGSSRAKFHLDILANLSKEECAYLLTEHFKFKKTPRKPEREFATAMNTLLMVK